GYPVFPFAILADHAIHPPPDLVLHSTFLWLFVLFTIPPSLLASSTYSLPLHCVNVSDYLPTHLLPILGFHMVILCAHLLPSVLATLQIVHLVFLDIKTIYIRNRLCCRNIFLLSFCSRNSLHPKSLTITIVQPLIKYFCSKCRPT
ncbi:hypothetical protein L9F63_026150, partial [Diploptera punctata]